MGHLLKLNYALGTMECGSFLCYGTRVRPHFRFGSEIWNWSENFVLLGSEKKPNFTWFTSMRNTKNLKRKRRWNKQKLSEKLEAKRKLSEKSEKTAKTSEKSEKKRKKVEKSENIDLNFALLCFALKQKWLNRSEVKILTEKKRIKAKKLRKIAKKSEKKRKNVLEFHFKWSEAKISEKREVKLYSEIVKHMWNGSKFTLFRL